MANSLSLYLVIAFASFIGGIVRGISGFGSAIVWIGIWVAVTSMGVDGGPLSLSVVTEALSCFVVSVPLVFMTGALRGKFSWEIFLAVLLIGYIFTPIGALLLKFMEPRLIELIMGSALVVVLLILLEAHLFVMSVVRHCRPNAADDQIGEEERLIAIESHSQPSSEVKETPIQAPLEAQQAEDLRLKMWREWLNDVISAVQDWCLNTALSLSTSEGRKHLFSDWKPSLWLLMWASVAGSCSGLMNGMTGMGGPPLILLYSFLEISKDIVRGTNSWLNVFSFIRVIIYITLGLIVADFWDVYVAGIVFHIVGVVLGNSLSHKIDQKLFQKILIGLVSICIVLLFCAAFGVT